MKLCIRAHDLGCKGTDNILRQLDKLGIDGVQMVCYKAYDDITYAPGAVTPEKAAAIGGDFAKNGKRSRASSPVTVTADLNPTTI